MREKSWEYAGKTVEEAVLTALEELGLERDDIYVEILEEPQKGFLGLGGKEARVRVELIGEWEVLGRKAEREEKAAEEPLEEEDPYSRGELDEERINTIDGTAKPLEAVREILGIIGIDAMVEAKEKEDAIVVDVWGDDVGLLIGKNGNTLEALQYLVNIGCRRTEEVTKRIVIDVEGYRKRRKARLEKQAEEMAQTAISRGEAVELPPMSPSERKIVHMAVRSMPGVHTESLGEGPDRRVIIRADNDSST